MINYSDMGLGLAFAALLIALTDLIFTLMDHHIGKPQNRTYIAILGLLGVNALCEIINTHASRYVGVSESAFDLIKGSQYVYFLTHSILAPLFFFYISFVVGRSVNGRISWKYRGTLLNFVMDVAPVLLTVLSETLILFNPLHHWIWYYDGTKMCRAWGEYIFVYGMGVFWMATAFVLLMSSWNLLSKGRKYSCAVCFLLVFGGIVTQLFNKDMRVEVLMEAVGFTGVLLFVENEDDRRDVECGVYNSAAFSLDLSAAIRNHLPMHLLIVRRIHFDKTANTTVSGRVDRETINRSVAEFLGTQVKNHFIYSIGHGRFALTIFNQTDENVRELARAIVGRFDRPWLLDGTEVMLTGSVFIVKVPGRAKTVADVLYIAECPIPENQKKPIMESDDLDWIVRHSTVETAVSDGLQHGRFEVYYQPTYHIDSRLHGAEALLRMHDPELGIIYPDEFIPIAEQLGLIDELDEFVLQEVCRFLRTGIPQECGVECINVNLSVLECMKEGFAERVIEIVDAAGVPKKLINFEITESVAAKDYHHLSWVVDHLKRRGFRFSIDDFGTGYSNMMSIFSLGADVIKIDKSVLWGAEEDELGMVLLKASIDMVRETHKKSLVEGVETEAHIAVLRELGCDYLQGFYFSKPLPKEQFIALIRSA